MPDSMPYCTSASIEGHKASRIAMLFQFPDNLGI